MKKYPRKYTGKISRLFAVTAILFAIAAAVSGCGGEGAGERASVIATEVVTAAPTATPSPDEEIAREIVDMQLDEKVWQMFIVAPEDIIDADAVLRAGDLTREGLERHPVGGVILFSKNIESLSQVSELLAGMQDFSEIPLFTAVDEEGGRVARLGGANIGFPKISPMREIGDTYDTAKAAEVGTTLGRNLKELGFNVDFAPVADTITVTENDDIGDRSFGTDPQNVAAMVSAEVAAMSAEGVAPVLKHFPGNGSISENTHTEQGICNRTLEELEQCELIPFKAGIDAGAGMVMAAHMAVPNVTGDTTPSSLSYTMITDILRGELDYDGVVITDALNMGAVTSQYSAEEAAIAAVNAGADILLMPTDAATAAYAIFDAVNNGEIPESRIDESVTRILKLKREITEQ